MTAVAYGIAMPASRGVLGRPVPLVLDRISAAPTAAFATFKLKWSYAGACIRVRRSSDNAEQDIGFINGSLDTNALLSWCGAGDGFVTKWYDQSGNARHWAQATAASQPKIVAAGALIADINGLPSLRFNGSSNWMSAGLALSNYISASAYAVMALARPTSAPADPGNPAQAAQFTADRSGWFGQGFNSTNFSAGHYDSAWRRVNVADSIPSNYVAVHRYDGATVRAWLNGGTGATPVAAGNVGGVTTILDCGRGAYSTGWFAGSMAALITFNTAPALSDINTAGSDWGNRAALTWSTAS